MKLLSSITSRKLASALLVAGCISISEAAHAQSNSPFIVNGVRLGDNIIEKDVYQRLKCAPSSIFTNYMWCATTLQERGQRGSFTRSISALHNTGGETAYSSLTVSPAFFAENEISQELARLTKQYGQKPKIMVAPPQADGTSAIIVTWGAVHLEPLDPPAIERLAQGETLNRGFMIDFMGNFRRSAQNGFPVYLISGGAGMIWSASFDRSGKGHLRITAADASRYQENGVPALPQHNDARGGAPTQQGLPNTITSSVADFVVLSHRPQTNNVRFVSTSIGKVASPEEVCKIFEHPIFSRPPKDHEVWSEDQIWGEAYTPRGWIRDHLRTMGVVNRQGFVELEEATRMHIEKSFSSCVTKMRVNSQVSKISLFFGKFLNRPFEPSCVDQLRCIRLSHIQSNSRETELLTSLFLRDGHSTVLEFFNTLNSSIETRVQEQLALAHQQRLEAERRAKIDQQRRLEIQRVEEQNRIARERQSKIDEIMGRGDLTTSQKNRMIKEVQ